MKEPILGTKTIEYYGIPNHTLIVHGGLHYIEGNKAPYFSITGELWNPRRKAACEAGGCLHDYIGKHFPQFADIIHMHLSDIDGCPMRGDANGWYYLAGALPGHATERYHANNSERHMPKPAGAPRKGEWDNTDYRNPTADECLQFFADHVRVSLDEATKLRDAVVSEWERTRGECEDSDSAIDIAWTVKSWKGARAYFSQWVEAQAPRWKKEADDCIAKYRLVVFGDPWDATKAV